MDKPIKLVLLQHDDHFNELMATLKHFAQSGILTDVALVTGTDVLHMHYLILSCFSNYFEHVVNHDNVKYFIYTDHRKTILQTMVDYVYMGMVNVPQITKRQLAVAATSLRIRGFMSMSINEKDKGNATVVCPNHQSQLTQKLWESRQEPYKNDVIFIVENKYKVYAHSFIVGACSSILLQVFTKHGSQKRKPYIVALPYVKKESLETVLEFCYKGKIQIPLSDVQSVYNVADLMGIKTLCKMLVTLNPDAPNITVPENKTQHCSLNIIRTSVVPTALSDLLRHEKLVDVFIFNSEKLFKAHSVILSMYSTYFKQLAKYLDYDIKDLFVLIKDLKSKNIEAMLEYIYTGEAKFEGNVEEFHESMSEWLDLNILPISSCYVANPDHVQIKNEFNNRINPSSSSKTVIIQETEIIVDGSHLESEKCSKKENIIEQNSRNTLCGKVKLVNAIKNVPEFLKKEKRDNKSKELNKYDESLLAYNMLETELGNQQEIIKCDLNVPEFVARNSADNTDTLSFNCENCHEDSQNEIILKGSWSNVKNTLGTMSRDAPKICDIHNDNIDSTSSGNTSRGVEFINGIEKELLVPDMIPGNRKIIYKTDDMRNQRFEEESDVDESDIMTTKNDNVNKKRVNVKKRAVKKLKCQTCLQNFSTPWDFKVHLSVHPKGNILICNYCQKEFTKSSEMKIHVRSHTGSRPFQCDICGMSFSIKNTLRKHELTHRKERPKEFECEICRNTFSRKQYLQEHKRTHSGNKPYECDICHKAFVGKTGLNHHKKTHKSADEKKSAVCEICGKSFTRHALWTHMKYHSKEHECEFCSKCFATTASLKIHVAGAHLGHSWHDCNTCGKGFIRKGHLIRHMKIHEEDKNMASYPCGDCSSKFKDESHLKAHVKRKHTELNTQSPTCGICSKHFSTKCALKYHHRLHFLERPHKCSICEKSFAVPYQLRDHMKLRHNEEKQFQCSVCVKTCATQALLKKHLLTHRPMLIPKAKPPNNFTCTSCDKTFSTKLALSNHSRSHNFSRPYQCNLCRKAFRYQDSLIKHLRQHPNEQSNETTQTKELPCIYTIQVCRPSFTSISSNIVGHENYINELPSNNIVQSVPMLDLNMPEKSTDISVIQLKPVEDYLSQPLLETEEVGFMQPLESDPECNVSLEKMSDITRMSERSYSLIIDENLCCNTALSTNSDVAPPINFFPERSELPMPVGMELPGNSPTLLPVEASSMVVIDVHVPEQKERP